MKRSLQNAIAPLLLTVMCTAPFALANPLFDGADPDILVEGTRFWIYPTTEDKSKKEFFVYASDDLHHWKRQGPILEEKDVAWIPKDGAPLHELWAPGIFKHKNKYYLYYAVGPQNPTPSRIGVAVCDTPDGKFVDSGKPLITGSSDFEAIDPMVFRDPKTDNIYLYCGGSAGAKLKIFQLNDDCVSIKKEVTSETPPQFTEAPFMHIRNDIYYLSYSHGKWNSDEYSVHFATSKTPVGPWHYQGQILRTDKKHAGPGHHSFAKDPTDGKWYVIYHRWNNAVESGKMPEVRSVSIDSVEYDSNGLMLPIVMTD
ncbi:MAG TPA: family 43 glycosylhydrolase [Drouetiella sp.]